jgi:hypothetical protein
MFLSMHLMSLVTTPLLDQIWNATTIWNRIITFNIIEYFRDMFLVLARPPIFGTQSADQFLKNKRELFKGTFSQDIVVQFRQQEHQLDLKYEHPTPRIIWSEKLRWVNPAPPRSKIRPTFCPDQGKIVSANGHVYSKIENFLAPDGPHVKFLRPAHRPLVKKKSTCTMCQSTLLWLEGLV